MKHRNWSSFNTGKLFSHVERWKLIQKNEKCPPPALITVDASNYCNLSCEWCNAWKVRKNERMLSYDVLINFVRFTRLYNFKNDILVAEPAVSRS